MKLESLTQTVESQTTHILALEKQITELTTHSNGNIQANKANRAATRKIDKMADRVADMAAISAPLSGQNSVTSEPQSNAKSSVKPKASIARKTSPHVVVE